MTKWKRWLIDKFLPAYCRDELLEANARLLKANAEQKQEIARLRAYISGLERGIYRRVVIRNEVSK